MCQYVSDRGQRDTPRPSVTSNGAANYEDYNVQCPAQRSGHFADTERGRGNEIHIHKTRPSPVKLSSPQNINGCFFS